MLDSLLLFLPIMLMFNWAFIIYIIFVTAIIITLLFVGSRYTKNGKKKNLHWIAIVGLLLTGACIYFFPFAAIDFYEATRIGFGLDYVQNSLLWYGICISLGAVGILLLKIGLKKGKRKVKS